MSVSALRVDADMTDSTQLRVMDFDCPTCASNVERAISKLDGVEDVEVHFTTGRVEVQHDDSTVSEADIEAAVERQGYTPQPA